MNREEFEKIYPNINITESEVYPCSCNTWISVNTKLPEKDGRYLVAESDPYKWLGVCSLRNGKWDSALVTHWQDLPEPPKETE